VKASQRGRTAVRSPIVDVANMNVAAIFRAQVIMSA